MSNIDQDVLSRGHHLHRAPYIQRTGGAPRMGITSMHSSFQH
jgi:hypothetical protein